MTQPLGQRVWDAGHAGLRWWSVFWGDWHGAVLFIARLSSRLRFDEPEPLTVESQAVRAAAGGSASSSGHETRHPSARPQKLISRWTGSGVRRSMRARECPQLSSGPE